MSVFINAGRGGQPTPRIDGLVGSVPAGAEIGHVVTQLRLNFLFGGSWSSEESDYFIVASNGTVVLSDDDVPAGSYSLPLTYQVTVLGFSLELTPTLEISVQEDEEEDEIILAPTTLGSNSYAENSPTGQTVSSIGGIEGGATLQLIADAGSRLALSGGNLVIGLVNSDYDVAGGTEATVTIRKSHPLAVAPGYRDDTFVLDVLDVSWAMSGTPPPASLGQIGWGPWTPTITGNPVAPLNIMISPDLAARGFEILDPTTGETYAAEILA